MDEKRSANAGNVVKSDMKERAMGRQTIIYVTARQQDSGMGGGRAKAERNEAKADTLTHTRLREMSACASKCVRSREQHFGSPATHPVAGKSLKPALNSW